MELASPVMLPVGIKCKAVNLSSKWDLDIYVLYKIASIDFILHTLIHNG